VQFPEHITIFGRTVARTTLWSTIRYLIVGFSTFGLDYLLNWFFIKVVGINYLLVGYLVSPVVLVYNFFFHKLWTYKDVGSKEEGTRGQVFRYAVLVGFNMVANMVLMYVFYGLFKLPLFPTRVLCVAVSLAWNFPVQRLWVYRKR
jgi:putative flippase GtrA